MLTISNTSPLLYLHQVGQLELLYDIVIVPPAVKTELEQGKALGVNVPDLSSLSWIQEMAVQSKAVLPLVTDLGAGETEVISLALEHLDSRIILDDQLARYVARLNNLTVTGTLGILLKAKKQGHIQLLKPVINELITSGMWLDTKLVAWILEEAHEL